MYTRSAALYDTVYLNAGKDYAAEARRIRSLARQYGRTRGRALLDMACGTGLHAFHLQKYYQVMGVDLNEEMLVMARERCPALHFQRGDMRTFNLHRTFDVITCLFSAIGYMKTPAQLAKAIARMAMHLKPGGVLLVEPWFTPDAWHSGSLHASFVDLPDLKIARMNLSENKGRTSFFTFHFMVGTQDGIETFTEYHELSLFTHEEYMQAFLASGLEVTFDEKGIYGRGVYIGVKPD